MGSLAVRGSVLLAVALLATGCSGDDPTDAARTGTSAAPAAPAGDPGATAAPAGDPSAAAPGGDAGTTAAPKPAACDADYVSIAATLQPQSPDMALLTATNSSKRDCVISGWPRVELVDALGTSVEVPTKDVKQPGASTSFTLKQGTSAFAGIKWVACGKADTSCHVGNSLLVSLDGAPAGSYADLSGFPDPADNAIAWKSLQAGTWQPSNQGVVAW